MTLLHFTEFGFSNIKVFFFFYKKSQRLPLNPQKWSIAATHEICILHYTVLQDKAAVQSSLLTWNFKRALQSFALKYGRFISSQCVIFTIRKRRALSLCVLKGSVPDTVSVSVWRFGTAGKICDWINTFRDNLTISREFPRWKIWRFFECEWILCISTIQGVYEPRDDF